MTAAVSPFSEGGESGEDGESGDLCGLDGE